MSRARGKGSPEALSGNGGNGWLLREGVACTGGDEGRKWAWKATVQIWRELVRRLKGSVEEVYASHLIFPFPLFLGSLFLFPFITSLPVFYILSSSSSPLHLPPHYVILSSSSPLSPPFPFLISFLPLLLLYHLPLRFFISSLPLLSLYQLLFSLFIVIAAF